MSTQALFGVFIEISGVDVLDGRYTDHSKAIFRANYLFNTGKYNFVRVAQFAKDGSKSLILEKRNSGSSKSSAIADVLNSYICTNYLDAYCYDSRITISQMMRNYFNEHVIIPSELLHNFTLLRDLSFDGKIVTNAATKLARTQVARTGGDSDLRKKLLLSIFADVISESEKSSQYDIFYQKFQSMGLSNFVTSVISDQPGEFHDKIFSYVISRELKNAKDWEKKVAVLCKLFNNDMSGISIQILDEFISEAINAASAIKALIGSASDLGSALYLLSLTYQGELTEKTVTTTALKQLNSFILFCKPPLTRAAIARVIAKSLLGNSLLTKQGTADDRTCFQRIVTTLQNQPTFAGDSDMSLALTQRAKVLYGTQNLNLPFGPAIHIVCELLTSNEQRFDYIIGLLLSDAGIKNTTVICEKVIELLGELSSEEILSLNKRMFFEDGSEQYIIERFINSGLPMSIINEIIAYLKRGESKPDVDLNHFRQFDNFSNSRSLINVVQGSASDDTLPPTTICTEKQNDATIILEHPQAGRAKTLSKNEEQKSKILKVVSALTGDNWAIYASGKKLIVGRSDACDIVINSRIVSRIHGHFLCTGNFFVFVDQSANGSFLVRSGKVAKVHKCNIVLEGSGSIIIAIDPTTQQYDKNFVLNYEIY